MNNAEVLLVLTHERASIVAAATAAIRRSRTHYQAAGSSETRRRLDALYDEVLGAVSGCELDDIVDYARRLADERFTSGYDLSEVQCAINALEEAVWSRLCARLQPNELTVPLGVVSTVLGAAKDALAREYVALASGTHVASLDMHALFAGDGAA